MKNLTSLVVGLGLAFSASHASAWSQPTHKNIVKDALAFLNSAHATPEMKRTYLLRRRSRQRSPCGGNPRPGSL